MCDIFIILYGVKKVGMGAFKWNKNGPKNLMVITRNKFW
jgi:hypothetical protein